MIKGLNILYGYIMIKILYNEKKNIIKRKINIIMVILKWYDDFVIDFIF